MIDADIVLTVVASTLLILLLLAIVILVFFISGKQRVKQEMEMNKAKLLFEQELRQVETEVAEHVMSQFAQELHDNIGQLHTAMHIQIENQKLDYPQLSEGFKPLEIYLVEVTKQLRLLSRTLNNDYIGHIGLLAIMQLEIERLRTLKRFQVNCPLMVGKSNLNKNQELMVFRIFQEISQNALRHSGAKNLQVNINNQNNNFELTVKDDGKGFAVEEILASNRSSGLRNIIKRAELGGLTCTISSSIGNGCLFTIKKIASLE